MNLKNLKTFGSARFTAYLTPNSFLKKIIVIDTTMRFEDGLGETAIANVQALNYQCVPEFDKLDWTIVKKHKNIKDAVRYHNKLVESKSFTDCKHIKMMRKNDKK